MARFLKRFLLAIFLLILAVGIAGFFLLRGSLPQLQGDHDTAGPECTGYHGT